MVNMDESSQMQPSETQAARNSRLDTICDAFQEAWDAVEQGTEPPELESFLDADETDEAAQLFVELLVLELAARQAIGDLPNRCEYLARFIEFASVIDSIFKQFEIDSPPPPALLQGGQRISRYRVIRPIGEGAFGDVFLAQHDDGGEVAIKTPKLKATDECDVAARFLCETQTTAEMDHPNIIAVTEYGFAEGRLYSVMNHVNGGTLREAMQSRKFSLSEAVRLVEQLADAVAYAHQCGVFHRDLSADNVLLDEDDNAYIGDFGMALTDAEQRSRIGEFAGSLSSMAPEQIRAESHRLDGRADIWALGVLLYELLTARRPFDGSNDEQIADEILHRDPIPPRQLISDIHPALERACLRCLGKSASDRYSTASDLAEDLRRIQKPAADRRRWPAILVAAATMCLVLAVAVWSSATGPWADSPSATSTLQLDYGIKALFESESPKLGSAGTLPVVIGQPIAAYASLDSPRCVYGVIVDPTGRADPIIPSLDGWDESAARGAAKELESEIIALTDPPGGVTMIFAVSKKSLSAKQLKAAFQDAPAALETQYDLLRYRDGRMVLEDVRIKKGVRRSDQADDPLLKRQRWIDTSLAPNFESVHTIHFRAVAGE